MRRFISGFLAVCLVFNLIIIHPPRAEAFAGVIVGESIAELALLILTACGVSWAVFGTADSDDVLDGFEDIVSDYESDTGDSFPTWSDVVDDLSLESGLLKIKGSAWSLLEPFLSWFRLKYGGDEIPFYSSSSTSSFLGIPLNQTFQIPARGVQSTLAIGDSFVLNGHTFVPYLSTVSFPDDSTIYLSFYFTRDGSFYRAAYSSEDSNYLIYGWRFVELSSCYSSSFKFFLSTSVSGGISSLFSGRFSSNMFCFTLTQLSNWLKNASGLSSLPSVSIDTSSGSTIDADAADLYIPSVDADQSICISAPADTAIGGQLLDGSLADLLSAVAESIAGGTAVAENDIVATGTGTATGEATSDDVQSVESADSFLGSLWDWAVGYVSYDTGIFSKFPLCVPYDCYYLFDKLSGGSPNTSDTLGWGKNSFATVSYGSDSAVSSYALNFGTTVSIAGITMPFGTTLNFTPYLSVFAKFKIFLSVLCIALFVSSFRRRGGDS